MKDKIEDKSAIRLSVNGKRRILKVDPSSTLLDVLRESLDLTGTKEACDGGECGSCIVLLGEKGVMSCLLPVSRARGKEITTIEGLAPQYFKKLKAKGSALSGLHPLQEAFVDLGASQCGFCIPGIIMEAAALLYHNPTPTKDDVVRRLSRNICRCTGYVKIIDAVLYAAELMRGGQKRPQKATNGRIVGESILRLDDVDKVMGRAKYAADLKMKGMLYAKVLRSSHHHARILGIDTSEAEAMPGVIAVVTAKDVPGDIAMMNSNRKSWSPRDYITYYAKEGRSEYKKLLKIIIDYPKVTNTAAIKLMNKNTSSYFSGGSMMPPMRAGNLDATHYDMAHKICELCLKLHKRRDYVFRADFILSVKIAVAGCSLSAQAACDRIFEKKHLLPDHVEYGEGCTRLLKDIVNH